jgi:hypothetical protein
VHSLGLGRDLRQVPDNQEVFVYPNSPISIIVEILERVAQEDDQEAAKFGSSFHSASKITDNGL